MILLTGTTIGGVVGGTVGAAAGIFGYEASYETGGGYVSVFLPFAFVASSTLSGAGMNVGGSVGYAISDKVAKAILGHKNKRPRDEHEYDDSTFTCVGRNVVRLIGTAAGASVGGICGAVAGIFGWNSMFGRVKPPEVGIMPMNFAAAAVVSAGGINLGGTVGYHVGDRVARAIFGSKKKTE
ncbi:MAG: hypothetical protein MRY21_07320 [Simkaniaceae bacterium]|nr:hypothetical protein [Simkaniaceae bacterium]